MDVLLFSRPAITHNPWHPAYKLTPEAQERVSKEIAGDMLRHAMKAHPGKTIRIRIGDVDYAGFVAHV